MQEKAKKTIFGEGQSAGRAAKPVPAVPTGDYTSWRDEKELVDYEPEEPAAFSPVEDDVSVSESRTPALEEGPAEFPPLSDDFCGFCRPKISWRKMLS